MAKKYLYKFLVAGMKSQYDGSDWEVGKWRKVAAHAAAAAAADKSKLKKTIHNHAISIANWEAP